jgi:hypothetical protein
MQLLAKKFRQRGRRLHSVTGLSARREKSLALRTVLVCRRTRGNTHFNQCKLADDEALWGMRINSWTANYTGKDTHRREEVQRSVASIPFAVGGRPTASTHATIMENGFA